MPTAPKILKSSRSTSGVKPKQLLVKDDRGSAHSRGYGRRWRVSRAGFLRKNPLCVHCLLIDRVVQATVVDHIIPHSGDMDLFWDRQNWQPLCASCHGRKTAGEDGGFGNKKRLHGGGG